MNVISVTILFYIVIGVLFQFTGPISREISKRKEVSKLFGAFNTSSIENIKLKRKHALLILSLRLISLLFYPIVFILYIIDSYRNKNTAYQSNTKNREHLYFLFLGGKGNIECLNCNYKESIYNSINEGEQGVSSYQCQNCGMIKIIPLIKSTFYTSINQTCSCGGELRDDLAVFCPKCHSKNLKYENEFLN